VIERIGCGGVVGEIALLRRTTRTATVRAATDCRLLEIEREEFLVAVGGNASSREAAGALVERRLARLSEA
jgi:CRP-like cAMP-binding protein